MFTVTTTHVQHLDLSSRISTSSLIRSPRPLTQKRESAVKQFPPQHLSITTLNIIATITTTKMTTTTTTIPTLTAHTHAKSQYTTTSSRLAARLSIHNYNTHPQSWFQFAQTFIPKSGSILEVGAGTGALWSPHAISSPSQLSSVTSLTLTDFSPAMVATLNSNPDIAALKSILPNVKIQQCDATSLPFPDSEFDTVVANHMLYHVDNPIAALQEFKRVLKNGGRLVVALNGLDHLKELFEIGGMVGRGSTIAGLAKITAENALEQIEGAGFEGVERERFPGEFRLPGVEPVLEYLDSVGETDMEEGKRETVKRVVGERLDEGGGFRVEKNMVVFVGRKP
ncbi:Putative methyltransferase [Podospora comata]|uniref:Methyltransferase n=1 Tax=Podospora comata TaxID=48703 RepID=A0ABY6SDF9_PODCO|nr:Putative methyltransferase [Podospora comata]